MSILNRLVLFVLITIASVSSFAESKYVKLVEDADKAVAKGDYATSIALLEAALKAEPDNSGNVMLISNMGMLNYYMGADSVAIYYLTLAHEMAPESVTILSNRAKVLTETGYYKQALKDWDAVSAMDTTLYEPHLKKGVIYLLLNDTVRASNALDAMCKRVDVTKSIECAAALAWMSQIKGDDMTAIKYYTILINDHPTADLYASRAMCYVNLENYPEASDDIVEGMSLSIECSELYVARACLNKRMYRNDDALNDAQRAIDLGADSNRVKALLNL